MFASTQGVKVNPYLYVWVVLVHDSSALRVLVWLTVVACAPPKSEPRIVPTHVPPPPTFQLPTSEPSAAWHLACDGNAAIPAGRRVIYQFNSTPLFPVAVGPRMADRPRRGKARTWLQLDETLARAELALSGCWKWASARGAPEGTLDIAFTMTPFGATTAHAVTSKTSGHEDLARCVQENLVNLALPELSPRTTRMHARVAFERTTQGKWPLPPLRPTPSAPKPRTKRCMPVLDDGPIDILDSPIDYTVDDFDEVRIPRVPGEVPTVTLGCHSTGHVTTSKSVVRAAVEANRGAFEACYADALARDARLTGKTIELVLVIPDVTTPTEVQLDGVADPLFTACMRTAAAELWIAESLPESTIEAHFAFSLGRAEDAGDPAGRLEDLVAKLRAATTDGERCEQRAWILDAFVAQAPWLDDRRVIESMRGLAQLAAKMPEADAKACLAPFGHLFHRIASNGNPLQPTYLRWDWTERLEAVLPIAHYLDWGESLRFMHAASLALSAKRHGEGLALLRALAASPTKEDIRELAIDELALYDMPKHVAKRQCLR